MGTGTGARSRLKLLGLAAGVTLTVIAWGVLVLAAIDFGRDGREGDTQGWYFLAAATVGAIACMFLAIVFASALQRVLRGERRVSVVEASEPEDLPMLRAVPYAAPTPPPSPPAAPEVPTYRSRHSNPDSAEVAEEPTAAPYRGKRAAR